MDVYHTYNALKIKIKLSPDSEIQNYNFLDPNAFENECQ